MGNSCSSNDTVDGNSQQKPQTNGNAKGPIVTVDGIHLPHIHCRNDLYPRTDDIQRCNVPDDKVEWEVEYPEYSPLEFFAVQEVPIEEDQDFRKLTDIEVKWNEEDGKVNRKSHNKSYEIVDGVARNPYGRTGVIGRGRLARWGPNHAADPVVSRWKRNEGGEIQKDSNTGKPILQFISIKRGDSGMWAIPGGFVDSGEEAISALKREFGEEALDTTVMSEEDKAAVLQRTEELFKNGEEIYRGYVDDPRNTDNSWMETVVVNFHDESGELTQKLSLKAGDDAIGVEWIDIGSTLDLYASHTDFLRLVAEKRNASW